MKRTCNGCKALVPVFCGGYCKLGYKLKHIYYTEGEREGWLEKNQPLEDCPKPMTNIAFANIIIKRGKKND
jgi:hypothetical protein